MNLSVPEAMYNLWLSEQKGKVNERLTFGQPATHQVDIFNRGRIERIELTYK